MIAERTQISLLQRIDEFVVVYGGRVDNFLNELTITVGVGCRDMKEDLQVLHLVGQCHHFLGGQDIQLHCISETRREMDSLTHMLSTEQTEQTS